MPAAFSAFCSGHEKESFPEAELLFLNSGVIFGFFIGVLLSGASITERINLT